jgi:hypothetical protein
MLSAPPGGRILARWGEMQPGFHRLTLAMPRWPDLIFSFLALDGRGFSLTVQAVRKLRGRSGWNARGRMFPLELHPENTVSKEVNDNGC